MLLCNASPDDLNDSPHRVAIEQTAYLNVTYTSMATLIALLERKNLLLKQMKKYNAEYERSHEFSEEFRQKFAWVVPIPSSPLGRPPRSHRRLLG